jgi:hypothetical protein
LCITIRTSWATRSVIARVGIARASVRCNRPSAVERGSDINSWRHPFRRNQLRRGRAGRHQNGNGVGELHGGISMSLFSIHNYMQRCTVIHGMMEISPSGARKRLHSFTIGRCQEFSRYMYVLSFAFSELHELRPSLGRYSQSHTLLKQTVYYKIAAATRREVHLNVSAESNWLLPK